MALQISSPELSGLTAQLLAEPISGLQSSGAVTKMVGLTLESRGPFASIGDLVQIQGRHQPLLAEVAGFRDNRLLLLPIEDIQGVRCGDPVISMSAGLQVDVGEALLGRVLDGLGRPIDGHGALANVRAWPVYRPAPNSMTRLPIDQRFDTGVRSIDIGLTCGRGQRVGIFAGSGVGKSTLLGMICRHSAADLNVIALIGERGKEVLEFVRDSLGPEGLARSVLVVATSDQAPLQRLRGADTAMAIAEYFREQGRNVLLIMDSLTRYAMAQREVGLAIGEPPTTKGYPPSVFSRMPILLERAGNSERGSITSFFTVLVEGDDLSDPIADTARGLLDGHIVLSRKLANRGHYPPVSILDSVSRVMNQVTTSLDRQMAQELRRLLALYEESEDIVAIGAYKAGSDAQLDRALALMPELRSLLQQGMDECTPWEATAARVKEILA